MLETGNMQVAGWEEPPKGVETDVWMLVLAVEKVEKVKAEVDWHLLVVDRKERMVEQVEVQRKQALQFLLSLVVQCHDKTSYTVAWEHMEQLLLLGTSGDESHGLRVHLPVKLA